MHIPSKAGSSTCGLAALIAAAFVGRPEPARAQFGISIGGFPIGINLHGYRGYRGGRRHRGSRGSRDEEPQSEERVPAKPTRSLHRRGRRQAPADQGSAEDRQQRHRDRRRLDQGSE